MDNANVFSVRRPNIAFDIGVSVLVINLSGTTGSHFFLCGFSGDFRILP